MTLICKSCPNGCELLLTMAKQGTVVSGNFCAKGIAFAVQNNRGFEAPFRQTEKGITLAEANGILPRWNLTAISIQGSSLIQGSPERSLRRTVIIAKQGNFILEQIDPTKVAFRETMANILMSIQSTIPVIPYCFGLDGKAIQENDGSFWMIHPFLFHTELNRETFWKSEQLGRTIGSLLVNLNSISTEQSLPIYSPKTYFESLVLSIGKTRIDVRKAITPIINYLKATILPEIEHLPSSFSHGDSHPLNMLWKNETIQALIDWEFCGIRPRIYDTALVIGCVGTESPEASTGECIKAIMEVTKPLFTPLEQSLLVPMTVLNRFNWLSEWLRRHDEEMIDFEIEYMHHLISRMK